MKMIFRRDSSGAFKGELGKESLGKTVPSAK